MMAEEPNCCYRGSVYTEPIWWISYFTSLKNVLAPPVHLTVKNTFSPSKDQGAYLDIPPEDKTIKKKNTKKLRKS